MGLWRASSTTFMYHIIFWNNPKVFLILFFKSLVTVCAAPLRGLGCRCEIIMSRKSKSKEEIALQYQFRLPALRFYRQDLQLRHDKIITVLTKQYFRFRYFHSTASDNFWYSIPVRYSATMSPQSQEAFMLVF